MFEGVEALSPGIMNGEGGLWQVEAEKEAPRSVSAAPW